MEAVFSIGIFLFYFHMTIHLNHDAFFYAAHLIIIFLNFICLMSAIDECYNRKNTGFMKGVSCEKLR